VALAAQPPNSLPGIDVSHWQGAIDWGQVAASGRRFVMAKASEGLTYVDPKYLTNRAGAMGAGLAFGAYHFARPDLHPDDPIGEADHFVDTAQLEPGNLLPILDIERRGNLTTSEVTDWILAWLGEVTARTGVRPMVYTSPGGWKDRTGDTTAIADAGYTTLWVAHWDVATPTLPANDWQGHGWTFWQYGNCGKVPGIQGCVDVDWFNGLDFGPASIPSPDATPPVATLATPPGVGGPVTFSFSEVVTSVTPGNTVFRVLDTGAAVPSTLTCRSKSSKEVDCSTGKVIAAVLTPLDPLVPGQSYAAMVNPPGAVPQLVDLSGNPAAPTEQDFAAPAAVGPASEAIRYGWRTKFKPSAYGGSYAMDHLAGASASFAFSGKSVTWYTVTGPSQGKAAVSVDGRARGTFDQYAPSATFKVARTFRHLEPGEHTITVRVLGRKGSPRATDALVAIDAFEAGGRLVKSPELLASWRKEKVPAPSGGRVAASDLARSQATLSFRGTGVDWHTVRGPDQGSAQVFVDGSLFETVDNFARQTSVSVRSIAGLADQVHQLRIVVLGQSRPAATATKVSVGGFTVVP
jgi:GH25 family lysozyme M1 (1,4-beta-N-acetylmuramidase)